MSSDLDAIDELQRSIIPIVPSTIRYVLFRLTKVGKETHWNMFSHAHTDHTLAQREFDLIKATEQPTPTLRIVRVSEIVIREE